MTGGLRLLAGLLLLPGVTLAAEVRVAVAANFLATAQDLAAAFEHTSGHVLLISGGSTGSLYAQVVNGAPHDIFLAADSTHPERLETEGHGVPGSRFTYARGRLVLWSPGGTVTGIDDLRQSDGRLAMANPRLAPYGLAAMQTLQAADLWQPLQDRLVLGQNISQAHQFVASGNAAYGFVALSQVKDEPAATWWLVPADRHMPLDQQALLLRAGPAAEAFLDFLGSPAAHAVIQAAGYELPRSQP